jgi:hypothetical protein
MPESHFLDLRSELADTERTCRDDIATMDRIIIEIEKMIASARLEPEIWSRYRRQWASSPVFARL